MASQTAVTKGKSAQARNISSFVSKTLSTTWEQLVRRSTAKQNKIIAVRNKWWVFPRNTLKTSKIQTAEELKYL